MSETSQKIEALIFASSKPVSENEIKKRLDLHEDISELLANLEHSYQHRGINLKKFQTVGFF
jgi:chromosome segregation and condensation protein ScpB